MKTRGEGISIQEVVHECRELTKAGLRPIIESKMKAAFGKQWETKAGLQAAAGSNPADMQGLLRVLIEHWTEVFEKALPRSARSHVFELRDWRNHVAHENAMDLDDTARMVDTAKRLLKAVGAKQAVEMEALWLRVLAAILNEPLSAARLAKPKPAAASEVAAGAPTESGDDAGAPDWKQCIEQVGVRLKAKLERKSGRCAHSMNGKHAVCCLVSKQYPDDRYWWTIHARQLEEILVSQSAFVAFACGSADSIAVIPIEDFRAFLPQLNPKKGGATGDGWHVHIQHDETGWWLLLTGRDNRASVTKYFK